MRAVYNRTIAGGLGGFIEGLIFTLILGTVLDQSAQIAAEVFGGGMWGTVSRIGQFLVYFTGAGIGAAIAANLEAPTLSAICGAIAGMMGAQTEGLISGSMFSENGILLAGPGELLAAFAAAYISIELGLMVTRWRKLDLVLVPIVSLGSAAVISLYAGPYIAQLTKWLLRLVSQAAAATI